MSRSLCNRLYQRARSLLRRTARRPSPHWVKLGVEQLESRLVPALPLGAPTPLVPLPLPNPLVPDSGDAQILSNVLKDAVKNRMVLDHLPVPYVIASSAINPLTSTVVTTVTKGNSDI